MSLDSTLEMQARIVSPFIDISQAPQLPLRQPVGILYPELEAKLKEIRDHNIVNGEFEEIEDKSS